MCKGTAHDCECVYIIYQRWRARLRYNLSLTSWPGCLNVADGTELNET